MTSLAHLQRLKMEGIHFNPDIVKENFNLAKIENDDVNLEYYLKSFQEFMKFFSSLGTVFGFVSSELNGKLEILKERLETSDKCHNFVSVKRMINYEKENNLFHKKGYISGSRTLLRLQWSLEFIQSFLGKIHYLQESEHTSSACISAYNDTLAQHHSFYIKTPARIAMLALPYKQQLLYKVCGSEESIKRAEEILPEILDLCSEVHSRIHKIYADHNLLGLP